MLPLLTPLPTPPDRNMTEAQFVAAANAYLVAMANLVDEMNAVFTAIPLEVDGIDYNGTSVTSLTVGTGTKNLVIEPDKLLQVGQIVRIASRSGPANCMDGQVYAYDKETGDLTVQVGSVGGSGTHSDWTISLSPVPGGLLTSGGTMTGYFTTATPAAGQQAFRIPHGARPTTPDDGSFWTTTVAAFARINGADEQLSAIGKAESLSNKTLVNPTLEGVVVEQTYSIADGAAFEVDPANGAFQTVTLGASRTPKATNFANGQSMTLLIDDGAAYSVTWTDGTWGGSGIVWLGGAAPALTTTGYTWIILMKSANQVYGALVGYTP